MTTAIEFENISKQYRLGLVSTGTLSHDLNRFWQTKVLRRDDPYLKVGETNDRAHKGNSDYVWALKDINLQKPLSLGHVHASVAATLALRVFKEDQGDVVGIIGRILGVSPAMPGPGRRGIKSPLHAAIFEPVLSEVEGFRGPSAID